MVKISLNRLGRVAIFLSLFTFVILSFSSSAFATVSLIAGNSSAAPVNQVLLNFTWTNSSAIDGVGDALNNITFNLPAGLVYLNGTTTLTNATTNMTGGSANFSSSTSTTSKVIFGNSTTTSNDTTDTAGWFAFNFTANASGTYTVTVNESYIVQNITKSTTNTTITLGVVNGTITLTNATFTNVTYSGSVVSMNFTATAGAATGGGNISDNITYTLYANISSTSTLVATNFSSTGVGTGGKGTANYTNATAGLYIFVWNTSGTTNYSATSFTSVLNISKAVANLTLFISNAMSNQTIAYPTSATLNGNASYGNSTIVPEPAFNLYIVNVTAPSPAVSTTAGNGNITTTQTLGNGTYQIIYNTTGNTNFTSAQNNSIYLLVTQGTPTITTFINNLNANQTITYPSTANVNGNSSSGGVLPTFNLYVNNATNNATIFSNTSQSNPVFLLSILPGNGTYQIIFNNTANANWTVGTNNTLFLLVNQGTPNVLVFINNTVTNSTTTYPNSVVNITGNSTTTTTPPTFSLYWGNTLVNSGNGVTTTFQFPAGTTQIFYNTSGNGNWASATNNTLFVIVNKGALNGTVSGSNVTYPTSLSITANQSSNGIGTDLNFTFWRNNTLVSSGLNSTGNGDTTQQAAGTYQYILNSSGGANWTSNASIASFLIVISKGILNGTVTGSNVTYPTAVTINSNQSANAVGTDLNFTFWRNTTLVFSGLNTTAADTTQLGAGTYQYVFNSSGGVNWTSNTSITSFLVVVSKGILNGTITGSNVTYPSSLSISSNQSANGIGTDLNFTFWRNTTLVISGLNTTGGDITQQGAGTYNYILNSSGGANWTSNASIASFLIVISKGIINATITGSNVTYPTSVNIIPAQTQSATSVDTDVNFTFWRNATLVSSANASTPTSDTTQLGGGTYSYVINTTGGANWTSNATMLTFLVVVSKGILNGTITGSNVTYPTAVTITSNQSANSVGTDLNFTFWRNGTLVSSGLNTTGTDTTKLGAGTYQYVFNSSGGANWTSNASILSYIVVVSLGSPTLGITQSPGSSISYSTVSTITGTGCPTDGAADFTCTLTRAGTAVSNPDVQRLGIGTYTYTFSGGGANWSSASTSATLAVTPNGASSGGSGGGGGGATGGIASTSTSTTASTPSVTTTQVQATVTTGQASASIAQITPTTSATVSIANSDTGVSSVQVNVNNQVNSIKLTINNLKTLPSGVSTPQGTLYKELRVDKTNIQDTDIKSVTINFAVQKSWLTANNIDPNAVTLQRYSNGQWQSLPATKTSEDSQFIYYSAVSPGLSYFAISGQQAQITTTTTTVPSYQPPSSTIMVGIIIVIVVIVGLGYFLMSKKKHR